MDLGISGKKALVVGATGDTGAAIALGLAAEGCEVLGVARGPARLEHLQALCPERIRTHRCDVTQHAQVLELINTVLRWGPPEIIVHVVGGSAGEKDALAPSGCWKKVWDLNVGVPIDVNRAFIPGMKHAGWGRIVHLSSNAVSLHIGHAPYASAKAALEGYVTRVGRILAPTGVVISAVRCGPIYTEGRPLYSQDAAFNAAFWEHYVPAGRWGHGLELAKMVVFLCGQEGPSYMPGAVVNFDGGMR